MATHGKGPANSFEAEEEAINITHVDESKTSVHQTRSDHEPTQPHQIVDSSLTGNARWGF